MQTHLCGCDGGGSMQKKRGMSNNVERERRIISRVLHFGYFLLKARGKKKDDQSRKKR
jgi:hypothetical protein